jgi:hypothetical protein
MSHATFMQGNCGDCHLLVVGSQIANLTPDLSFGHNLCFKYSHVTCEPILDIYNPRYFQWYKELFDPMGFDPYNCSLKIQNIHWDSNSQNGSSLGSVMVHFFTLSHTLGNMKCDFWASLLARTFASPCFGCEPKAKVMTCHVRWFYVIWFMCVDNDSCRCQYGSGW